MARKQNFLTALTGLTLLVGLSVSSVLPGCRNGIASLGARTACSDLSDAEFNLMRDAFLLVRQEGGSLSDLGGVDQAVSEACATATPAPFSSENSCQACITALLNSVF